MSFADPGRTSPSYVVARPARDLLQAARQQLTRDWWDLKREHYELLTSQIVLDEIAFGEKAAIQARLRKLADASGYTLPVICTPEELLEDDHEQND